MGMCAVVISSLYLNSLLKVLASELFSRNNTIVYYPLYSDFFFIMSESYSELMTTTDLSHPTAELCSMSQSIVRTVHYLYVFLNKHFWFLSDRRIVFHVHCSNISLLVFFFK